MTDCDEIYEADEVRAVMAACATSPTGLRDAAIVHTLWCTGLRCAEMCSLMPADIDRERGTVWVAHGKGGISRTVVVPGRMRLELWARLDKWLKARADHAWVDSPLFCSLHGGRLDDSYVRRTLKLLAANAGLSKRFHPHGLRHTFAAKMHLGGVSLGVIQQQLGHADLTITGRYLRKICDDTLRELVARA